MVEMAESCRGLLASAPDDRPARGHQRPRPAVTVPTSTTASAVTIADDRRRSRGRRRGPSARRSHRPAIGNDQLRQREVADDRGGRARPAGREPEHAVLHRGPEHDAGHARRGRPPAASAHQGSTATPADAGHEDDGHARGRAATASCVDGPGIAVRRAGRRSPSATDSAVARAAGAPVARHRAMAKPTNGSSSAEMPSTTALSAHTRPSRTVAAHGAERLAGALGLGRRGQRQRGQQRRRTRRRRRRRSRTRPATSSRRRRPRPASTGPRRSPIEARRFWRASWRGRSSPARSTRATSQPCTIASLDTPEQRPRRRPPPRTAAAGAKPSRLSPKAERSERARAAGG